MAKKNYTLRFKTKVVKEAAVFGKGKSTARKHGIQASQICAWHRNIDLILEQAEKSPKKLTNIRVQNSKMKIWKFKFTTGYWYNGKQNWVFKK